MVDVETLFGALGADVHGLLGFRICVAFLLRDLIGECREGERGDSDVEAPRVDVVG